MVLGIVGGSKVFLFVLKLNIIIVVLLMVVILLSFWFIIWYFMLKWFVWIEVMCELISSVLGKVIGIL